MNQDNQDQNCSFEDDEYLSDLANEIYTIRKMTKEEMREFLGFLSQNRADDC